jgi:hypothetical protein
VAPAQLKPEMNNLTIKQERMKVSLRSMRRLVFSKIGTLEALSAALGMNQRQLSSEERTRRLAKYGHLVPLLLARLVSASTPDFGRVAVSSLLDYFTPGWRSHISDNILGYIVKRNSPEVRTWRNTVLERDGHKCVDCGSVRLLHAHHVLRWADYPALRVSLDNGITLCEDCHLSAHKGSWSTVPHRIWAQA